MDFFIDGKYDYRIENMHSYFLNNRINEHKNIGFMSFKIDGLEELDNSSNKKCKNEKVSKNEFLNILKIMK